MKHLLALLWKTRGYYLSLCSIALDIAIHCALFLYSYLCMPACDLHISYAKCSLEYGVRLVHIAEHSCKGKAVDGGMIELFNEY